MVEQTPEGTEIMNSAHNSHSLVSFRSLTPFATTTTSVAAAQRDVQSGTQESLPVHLNLSSWYGFSNTSANTEFRAFAAVASKGVGDGPKVLEVTTTGGKTISGQNQSVSSRGLLYLPPKQEAFGYDANGNLTSDSLWQYRWDAENRLKEMETTATAVAAGYPATKLAFQYDSQHRRVRKAVYRKLAGAGSWQLTRDLRFLYDGWNLLAEIAVIPGTNQKKLLRTYAWGPDISGSRQGAGGVAGLLIVKQYLATGGSKYLAPTYDANGNIMAYYDLETKQAAYRFEYDAFGREITFEQGPAGNQPSEAPPFRFSTKYTDGETGLVCYGYRYYNPELGRWLSRDPIGERGGLNLYGMVGNDVVNRWDYLGLKECKVKSLTISQPEIYQHPDNSRPDLYGGIVWFPISNNQVRPNPPSPGTNRDMANFRINAEFEKPDCGCCEVRQYIKKKPGDEFQEDTVEDGQYGHRDQPADTEGTAGSYFDGYFDRGPTVNGEPTRNPNQAGGSSYEGTDSPATNNSESWTFDVRVIDTCNGNKIKANKTFTIKWP